MFTFKMNLTKYADRDTAIAIKVRLSVRLSVTHWYTELKQLN